MDQLLNYLSVFVGLISYEVYFHPSNDSCHIMIDSTMFICYILLSIHYIILYCIELDKDQKQFIIEDQQQF